MAGLWKHFKDGGWGMYPIVIVSIFSIGIIIERALYLYGSSINKDVFLATMQKCILAGDVAKAVKMCSAANAPLARIVQAGLVKVNRPDEEKDVLAFLKKKQASFKNFIFASARREKLIDAIDPNWQGQVPYTILLAPDGQIIDHQLDRIDPLALRRAIVKALNEKKPW